MTAYAYLRKSSVRDPARDVSHEVQEAAVRDLAGRHGHDELVLLSDWDKSGRLGADKRPGYRALLEAIASDRADAVYSYSLSRLGRSLPELSRLIEDCEQRGIPVRLAVDAVDTSTASGRLLANVLGSVAAFEADVASERVRASNAAKLARGESLRTTPVYGDGPGEDVSTVLAAFDEAGSYTGAARLLNQQGIKPRNSTRGWWPSAVRVVVMRMRPGIRLGQARGASAGGGDFALAGLLRCPTCATRLTGTRDRVDGPNGGRVRYACRMGSVLPHPRVSVSEHLILPAFRAEVAHQRRLDPIESQVADERKRGELQGRRERILDMFEAGHVDRADRDRRLAAVDDDLARLDVRRVVRSVPVLDWEWPPRELNAALHAMFEDVTLDPQTFQPVAFRWFVPEWRRAA